MGAGKLRGLAALQCSMVGHLGMSAESGMWSHVEEMEQMEAAGHREEDALQAARKDGEGGGEGS